MYVPRNEKILPHDVLWRKKEAFSDGVSNEARSWHEIIKEKINFIKDDDTLSNSNFLTGDMVLNNTTLSLEQEYYFRLFQENYKNDLHKSIPYYWMPKFVNATDASARTLNL